jgi:hypothetical protein
MSPDPSGSVISVLSENGFLRRWELGFEQSGSYHVVRALRSVTLHTFKQPPLSGDAIFLSGFRFRVDPVAQRYPSQPLPPTAGIRQSAYAAHISANYGV